MTLTSCNHAVAAFRCLNLKGTSKNPNAIWLSEESSFNHEFCFTLAVGELGFWDEQNRVAKFQQKKQVLRRLSEAIPWETFHPLIEDGYTQ